MITSTIMKVSNYKSDRFSNIKMYAFRHLKIHFPFFLGLGVLLSCFSCVSIKDGDKSMRPSPPMADTSMVRTTQVTINYSSPGVKKRKLLDGLIPLNKVWRTGANEATVFTADKDLLILGQKLPKGRYAFFTKASKDYWQLIFNSEWDQWGSYSYDQKKDVLRIEVLPYQVEEFQERMLLKFKEEQLIFHWGNLQYSVEIEEAD